MRQVYRSLEQRSTEEFIRENSREMKRAQAEPDTKDGNEWNTSRLKRVKESPERVSLWEDPGSEH